MNKESKQKVLFLKEEYADGQGKYTYPNGESYVGDWKKGEFHGKGTYTSPDEGKYEGKFKSGNRDGKGIITTLDGCKFVGKFKNDKAEGHGKATFSGEILEGEWKDEYNLPGGMWIPTFKFFHFYLLYILFIRGLKSRKGCPLSFQGTLLTFYFERVKAIGGPAHAELSSADLGFCLTKALPPLIL